MNYAYLSHIRLNHSSAQALYVQLRDALRSLIVNGTLSAGQKLPSSRFLSEHYKVHRQTVVTAINELLAEGWLVSHARKGIFVNDKLPLLKPKTYGTTAKSYPTTATFSYKTAYHPLPTGRKYVFGFDDGYPDIRIAPSVALGKTYVQTLSEKAHKNTVMLTVGNFGNIVLREELARMMREFRGMPITANNILITHGSQMSIFLVAERILSKGDNVIVTRPSYLTANNCFVSMGANLVEVSVDNKGMNADEVEAVCKRKKIKLLFVTSHHHHPTTVTLSIERRLKLLQLAERYGFAIIEDDYDYDYHYENKPLLPIASNDKHGNVLYIGSFSKILSQAFRVGYIIGPQDFIRQVGIYRRLVDRQGDQILEESLGKLLQNNVIKNHIRKATQLYKERRDRAYALLRGEFNDEIQCELPEGGLVFWAHFDRKISLPKVSEYCAEKGVFFPDGRTYSYDKTQVNACRMGFASMNEKELNKAVDVLRFALKKQGR